jgi:hypothetical protein
LQAKISSKTRVSVKGAEVRTFATFRTTAAAALRFSERCLAGPSVTAGLLTVKIRTPSLTRLPTT